MEYTKPNRWILSLKCLKRAGAGGTKSCGQTDGIAHQQPSKIGIDLAPAMPEVENGLI